ncbi:MAG: PqqD family protein [Ruminococcus sp.]|nr:PqqD family protein [Ruminococcus sp.]
MKIKEDFVLRKVADSFVVVPVNDMSLDFNGIINLNETGAFLFEALQSGATSEELLDKLLDEYEVTEAIAKRDIEVFLGKVKEADILE